MWRKVLSSLIILLVLSLAAASGLGWWVYHRSLPVLSGRMAAGVKKPVEIYRDDYGVPHIYAQSEEDLFYAQGYVMAQDRLWQMDLTRRAVSGRLAEIFGPDYVGADHFLRTIGFKRVAQEAEAALSPEIRRALEAYARGINDYIAENRRRLPLEFTILGYEPDPWTVADSLAIGKYMAWDLGGNMQTELFLAALVEKLGLEKARTIFPHASSTDLTILPPGTWRGRQTSDLPPPNARRRQTSDLPSPPTARGRQTGSLTPPPGTRDHQTGGLTPPPTASVSPYRPGIATPEAFLELLALSDLGHFLGRAGSDLGSNNWVVGGSLTASGRPLLANDMHLEIKAPSIWYQNHLVVPGQLNVTGVMFPGVPGVIVGHNDRIAWGVTNVGPDVQDLYIEKPNPANPHEFEYNGKWEKARVIQEKIYVKGQKDPVVKEVVITRHGPIISNVVKGVKEPLSLRWTAYDRTEEFEAVLGFMRARNWEEFKAALEHFAAPAQNFVFADVDGNIAYRANGLFPLRKEGDGLLPVPGWTDAYEWTGYIPWAEVPQIVNPPEGFIVTANNRVYGDEYPYFLGHQWAQPYRAMSIRAELEGKKGLKVTDMEKIQNDWKNLQAQALYPVIAAALPVGPYSGSGNLPADIWWKTPEEEKARQILAQWAQNPQDRPDSPGPAIFHYLYWKMLFRTFHDEMGDDLFQRFLQHGSAMNTFDAMLVEWGKTGRTDSPWFDDVQTPERETPVQIIRQAFRDTVSELKQKLGPDPEKWTWGRLHTITFDHPLGKVKPLNLIFDRGPFPYGGSKITAGAASYSLTDPFAVTSAGPWRYVVDLGDLNHGQDVLAIGASGQPASRHYADQMDLWLTGRYKTMWFEEKDIKTRFADKKMVLEPGTPGQ